MIVARHEVPGTAPPQKSRPVGYGMIRAGLSTDSTRRSAGYAFMAFQGEGQASGGGSLSTRAFGSKTN